MSSRTLTLKHHLSPSSIREIDEETCLGPSLYRMQSEHRFGPTPSTFLGNLFHKLIEDAGKGIEPTANLKKIQTKTLRDVPARRVFAQNDPRGFRAKRSVFLALAMEAYNPNYIDPISSAQRPAKSSTDFEYETYSKPLKNGESFEHTVAYNHKGVWLYGTIDHLIVTPKSIIITDFKTGRMTDQFGVIKSSYRTQMLVYGWITSKLSPNREIKLQLKGMDGLGKHRTLAIDFDPNEALDIIDPIVDAYTTASADPSLSHMKPGSGCRWCSLRANCSSYRKAVDDDLWRSKATEAFAIPLDIWGTIKSIEPSGRPGSSHVIIEASNGRYEVQYVPDKELSVRNKTVGSYIEIYGAYHPSNGPFTNLPRRLQIGPSNDRYPWNQAFSYIII